MFFAINQLIIRNLFKAQKYKSHESLSLSVKALLDSYIALPPHSDLLFTGYPSIAYRCRLSGSRSVSRKITISRHRFRKYTSFSLLTGFNRGV